jgi:hypothetical protein
MIGSGFRECAVKKSAPGFVSGCAEAPTHENLVRLQWREYCRRNQIQNDPLEARRLERERERGNVAPSQRFGAARQGFDPNKLATLGLPNPALAITAGPAQPGMVCFPIPRVFVHQYG